MEDQEQPEKEIQPEATVQTPISPPEAIATIEGESDETAQQIIVSAQPEDEEELEALLLAKYKEQYDKLPTEIQSRCIWTAIQHELLANNSDKLKLAIGMRRGGILFGIDSNSRALFKDCGSLPIKYGRPTSCPPGGTNRLIEIKSFEDLKKTQPASYFETRESLHRDGYELFPYEQSPDGKPIFSDEIKQAEAQTGEKFVYSSGDLDGFEASFLENGGNPSILTTAAVHRAGRLDNNWNVALARNTYPRNRSSQFVTGVIRLLRV